MEGAIEGQQDILVPFSTVTCDQQKLYILTLPESGNKRPRKWCFGNQIEEILYGTRGNSNLWFLLQELGLDDSGRVLDSKTYGQHHLSQEEFKEVIRIFNAYRRSIDPLIGVAKKCNVLPKGVCATLAMTKGHKQLLRSLGQSVPEEWERLEQQAKNSANDEVDLNLDDQIAADKDTGTLEESYNIAIQDELLQFDTFEAASVDEERLTTQNYALSAEQQSPKLKKQLEAFKEYRTTVLNSARTGSNVQNITVQGNISCLLRFLGWSSTYGGMSSPIDMDIFRDANCRKLIDDYTTWLQTERQISFSSIANYINGLMQVMLYLSAETGDVPSEMEECYAAAFNLRSQAQSAAMEDLLWKEKHPQWLSWDDCQLTRQTCLKKYESVVADPHANREQKLEISKELVLLCLLTILPPDRVGVTRKLSDSTLRKTESGWVIDLTKERRGHKTSRFTGPTITKVSDITTPFLEKMFELEQSQHNTFEFTEEGEGSPNRTSRRYIFSKGHPTRCFSESEWSAHVKNVFCKHSPGGKKVPPKLLRSIFITALKSSAGVNEELKQSVASHMKHHMDTQGSDHYDVEFHQRLTQKAVDWCESYAKTWIQQQEAHVDDSVMDTEHTPVTSPSKKRKGNAPTQTAIPVTPMSDPQKDESSPSEGTIELILGATPQTDESVRFHIQWEGHAHLKDWHQSLDTETSKASLRGITVFERCVLELNDGKHKKLCVVSAYNEDTAFHELRLANGVSIEMEMHTCTLSSGGSKVAWKIVQTDIQSVLYTDAVMNWTSTPALKACKVDWADGSCFPDFSSSRTVLLNLQAQHVFTMESTPTQCESLAKLCQWLKSSLARELVTVRFEAEKLQSSFLEGSLILDALKVILSVDELTLSKWKRSLKQKNTVDALI